MDERLHYDATTCGLIIIFFEVAVLRPLAIIQGEGEKEGEILQGKNIFVLGCAVGACLVLLLMLRERYRLLALIISVSWLMFIAECFVSIVREVCMINSMFN